MPLEEWKGIKIPSALLDAFQEYERLMEEKADIERRIKEFKMKIQQIQSFGDTANRTNEENPFGIDKKIEMLRDYAEKGYEDPRATDAYLERLKGFANKGNLQ